MAHEFKLCFVKDCWAYFTTQPLTEVSGEKWRVFPYEHNAGEPQPWSERHDAERVRWEILKVAWEGLLDQPCDNHFNSPWTLEQINAGAIAWLRGRLEPRIVIPAGATLAAFCTGVEAAQGTVYFPRGREGRG